MLSINYYNQIIKDCSLDRIEKIDNLVSCLCRDEVVVNNSYLKIDDGYNYYQDLSYSTSLIKVNNNTNHINKTESYVFEVIEHQKVVSHIVDLINKICLKEDRLIFIDRKINHLTIAKIMDKYYISQNSYYDSMNNCYRDIYHWLGFLL